MKTIALCIPAYNAENCLPRLLTSAMRQTVPFDEILVYNDCSTDKTREVAEEYGAKVVDGDINRGCSHGKNVLARTTHCDWIHFHDADDELYPHFVQIAREWIARNDPPDVVLFDYEYRDGPSKELLSVRQFDAEKLKKDPIAYSIEEQINPFCGLYNKSAYWRAGGYDEDPLVLYNEDDAFHGRLSRAGLRFDAESRIAIVNYRREASMSYSNGMKCLRSKYYVLHKAAEELQGKYEKEISERLWKAAGCLAAYLDWEYADRCVRLTLQLGFRAPEGGGALFRCLCMVNPWLALRIREYLLRLFRPSLRKGVRHHYVDNSKIWSFSYSWRHVAGRI